jgi:hypothetical protein
MAGAPDAPVHDGHPLPPRPFAIEGHAEPELRGVERVLDEIDALSGDALAQAPGQRARSLLHLRSAHRDRGEPLEELGHRLRLQDDVVLAFVERSRVTRRLAHADGARRLLVEAQCAHVAMRRAAVSGRAAGAGGLERPHAKRGHRRVVRSQAPARRREGVRGARRLEHPGADEARVADRGEHGQEALDALVGGRARRRLLEARGALRRRVARVRIAGEAGEPVDLGDQTRGERRAADRKDQRRTLEPARHGLGDLPPAGDANDRHGLGELHVLTELSAREARASSLGDAKVDLGLALAGLGEHVATQREQVRAVHDELPTVTSRKRAGDAPWPTCMACTGSPFPHVEMPQSRQSRSPQTASHERQKCGVMPV